MQDGGQRPSGRKPYLQQCFGNDFRGHSGNQRRTAGGIDIIKIRPSAISLFNKRDRVPREMRDTFFDSFLTIVIAL